MNLEKAIELGKEAKDSLKQGKFHDHADAVQILIECARRIVNYRRDKCHVANNMLPGETRD